MNSPTPRRGLPLVKSALAALTVGTLAAALAIVSPFLESGADAADVPGAITALSYAGNHSTPLQPGDTFRLDATWAIPSTAAPGDTFTVGFPSNVTGKPQTFPLTSASGDEIASCVVGASSLICTLSPYVEDHVGLKGTLNFYLTLPGPYDELLFTLSEDVIYRLPVPPNPNPTPRPTPTPTTPSTPPPPPVISRISKYATRYQGLPAWGITVPAEFLTFSGIEVPLTDTYDEFQTPTLGSILIQRIPQGSGTPVATLQAGTGPDTYTLTPNAGPNQFSIAIHEPVAGMYYRIIYGFTVAEGTPDGTVLTNTVEGWGRSQANQTYQEADGKGDGYPAGKLSVTKIVHGTPPTTVTGYPIDVDCTFLPDPSLGYHRSATVAAGATTTFTKIPLGSTCTVTETDTFGATVEYSPSPTIAVTTSAPRGAVTVTNTFPPSGQLTVIKHTAGDAPAPQGTFPVDVACTLGEKTRTDHVTVAVDQPAIVTGITVGSTCRVTETDDRGASVVTYDQRDVEIATEGSNVDVVVTNTYLIPRGTLQIIKKTAGNGAVPASEFAVQVECTTGGKEVADFPRSTAVRLSTPTRLDRIPVGSVCSVRETDSRGASAVSYSAKSVTITDTTTPATITIVNTYTTGGALAFTGRDLRTGIALLALAQVAFLAGAILVIAGRRRRRGA